MPPKMKAVSELGTIVDKDNQFRAHVTYRDAAQKQVDIRGPCRNEKARAEADLDQMRAAGGLGETREEGLKMMATEATTRAPCTKRSAPPARRSSGGARAAIRLP